MIAGESGGKKGLLIVCDPFQKDVSGTKSAKLRMWMGCVRQFAAYCPGQPPRCACSAFIVSIRVPN
jgi:hypothetical protein